MITHSFYYDDAMKYGVDKAVLLQNIRWHVIKKRNSREDYRDNRTWVYYTGPDLAEWFQYWSLRKIQRTLQDLVETDKILIRRYSMVRGKKVAYYALADEQEFMAREASHIGAAESISKRQNGRIGNDKNDATSRQKRRFRNDTDDFSSIDLETEDVETNVEDVSSSPPSGEPSAPTRVGKQKGSSSYTVKELKSMEGWNDLYAVIKDRFDTVKARESYAVRALSKKRLTWLFDMFESSELEKYADWFLEKVESRDNLDFSWGLFMHESMIEEYQRRGKKKGKSHAEILREKNPAHRADLLWEGVEETDEYKNQQQYLTKIAEQRRQRKEKERGENGRAKESEVA